LFSFLIFRGHEKGPHPRKNAALGSRLKRPWLAAL